MSPMTTDSEYKRTMGMCYEMGLRDPKEFPIAPHCRECTQTREYCFVHGCTYPSCSNEPNKQEKMRLYP